MKKNRIYFSVLVIFAMLLSLFSEPAFINTSVAMAQQESPTTTLDPTQAPVEPTQTPSDSIPPSPEPTQTPPASSAAPTEEPTQAPTAQPTLVQTEPSQSPTPAPTATPLSKSEVVPLIGTVSGQAIPQQYIVVYKPGVVTGGEISAQTSEVSAQGGDVLFVYKSAIQGFAARLSPELLNTLRQDPQIDYIEIDQKIHVGDPIGLGAQTVQSNPTWGLDRIDQHNLPLDANYYYPASTGSGVNVYVVDTGILPTHVEFGGRASLDFDSVGSGVYGQDCEGHGTGVASIIGGSTYGVAKKVALHSVRVFDCAGNGNWSGIIAGLDWIKLNHVHPAVVNLSLGGDPSPSMDAAVKALIAQGVTVVVSAGNDNDNACLYSPARVTNAITVGATDESDHRANFSDYGSCLDIFAPGVDITTAYISSDTATGVWGGTSTSAPFVAGAAALYLAGNPSASPSTVASVLITNSTKNVVVDPVGSPNRLLYTANGLKAAPVLDSPATNSFMNDNTPTLSWKNTYNADTYEVRIDDSSGFASPLTLLPDPSAISGLNYTPTTVLAEGKWYWQVRAKNANGTTGAWSTSRYFTVDTIAPAKPVQTAPCSNLSTLGTPTFSWKASPTASRYQFEYNNTENPDTYVYRSVELSTLTHKPPAIDSAYLLATLYWYVNAKDAAGNWSGWSAPCTFTVQPLKPAAPALDTPATGFYSKISTPELKWKSVAYGATFELQIDNSSTFISPFTFDKADINGLTYLIDSLLDGKYYWHVRAKNVNGVFGPWSTYRYFTVDTVAPPTPVLSAPIEGFFSLGTPTFSWKASTTASRYQFAYNSVDDLTTLIYHSVDLSTTAHKPPTMAGTHSPTTLYYWYVRAGDAAGNWSPWSAPRTILIQPTVPITPVLSAPATGYETNNMSLVLSWVPVAYGNTYQIQISGASNFSNPLPIFTSDVGASSDEVGPLLPGLWYWHVKAFNVNNVPSNSWSSSRSFRIYSSFNSQFNSDTNFEGWEANQGAPWNVSSGSLRTSGLNGAVSSSASYSGGDFSDFTFEARIKMDYDYSGPSNQIDNVFGLVVRGTPNFSSDWNDWQNGYYFLIGQAYDPASGYREPCYEVIKLSNWTWTDLANGGWYCYGDINFGDWNTLKVYAKGTTMKFYINNSLIWSKAISGPTTGRLGIVTWRQTGVVEPTYVDWATAGRPISTAGIEQIAPGQRPFPFKSGIHSSK